MTNGTDIRFFLSILLLTFAAGANAETSAGGQVRTTLSSTEAGESISTGLGLFGRIAMKTKSASGTGGEAAFELILFARPEKEGADLAAPSNDRENPWRITDTVNPVRTWRDDGNAAELRQNIDRLLVFFSGGPFDVTMGRQAVSFGPGKFANPTDVFVPWRYDDIIRIDRSGIDALRIKTSFGGFRVLDAGIVAGEDGRTENNAGFLRFADNIAGTDGGLIVVRFRENTLAGFDLQGSVADAGVWAEASHTRFAGKHTLRPDGTRAEKPINRLATGSDYIFSDGTYLAGELILNDQGYNEQSIEALTDPRFPEARIALTGKSYAGAMISHPLQPVLVAGTQVLWNAGDKSTLILPSLTWSLSDSAELVTGFSAGTGEATTGFSARSRRIWCSLASYF